VPAESVAAAFREPWVHLWLGADAHLVHYPIKAGEAINLVAIIGDEWREPGWSAPGEPEVLAARFRRWARAARELIGMPTQWQKWALYDRPGSGRWGAGPITLMGDAAHPMLPHLAQGGAMAIEDAAVLAECLRRSPEDPAKGLRRYEGLRGGRTAAVQAEARANSRTYHLTGLAALARNVALAAMGGDKLVLRYDWIYDWRPA